MRRNWVIPIKQTSEIKDWKSVAIAMLAVLAQLGQKWVEDTKMVLGLHAAHMWLSSCLDVALTLSCVISCQSELF